MQVQKMQVEMQKMQEMSTEGKQTNFGKAIVTFRMKELVNGTKAKTTKNYKIYSWMLQYCNVKNISQLYQIQKQMLLRSILCSFFAIFEVPEVYWNRMLVKLDSVISAKSAPCQGKPIIHMSVYLQTISEWIQEK